MSTIDDLVAEARSTYQRVTVDDLDDIRRQDGLIVDIRPVGDRIREGALPGALVIDRNVLEWRLDPNGAHRIPEVDDPRRPVVLVCNEGYATSLAVPALRRLGLTAATDLVGGFRAWRATVLEDLGGPVLALDR